MKSRKEQEGQAAAGGEGEEGGGAPTGEITLKMVFDNEAQVKFTAASEEAAVAKMQADIDEMKRKLLGKVDPANLGGKK